MERVTREGGAPFELVAGIEARHKGLRHLEIYQHRGKAGYGKTGLTYVTKHDGRLAEADERPSESAEEIAAQVFTDAVKHHADHQGNRAFKLVLYSAKKDSVSKGEVTFSLDDSDDIDGDSVARIEAVSRASFVEELKGYVAQLHAKDIERVTAVNSLLKSHAEGARQLFEVVTGTVIPQVLEMRLDALEDRAEAFELGAQVDPRRRRWTRRAGPAEERSEGWKEAADGLKQFLGGPMGQLGLAKALGVSPEQVAAYLQGQFGEAGAPGATPAAAANGPAGGMVDVRPTIKRLYFALSAAQREALKTAFGDAWVQALSKAGLAGDPLVAVQALRGALDGMSEDQFGQLEQLLDASQQAIIDELFLQLEQIAKSTPTA